MKDIEITPDYQTNVWIKNQRVNFSNRMEYNKKDEENQRKKLQSMFGGKTENHRIQGGKL